MASVGDSVTDWVDRDAMCRVCLCPNPVAKWSLFECTIVGRSIAEILNEVAGISVQQGDNYPTVCCSGCLKLVELAQRLREQCQESDRRLAKIFEKLKGVTFQREEPVQIKEEPEDEPMEEESVPVLQIAAIHGLIEEPAPVVVEKPSTTVISNFQVNGLEIKIEVPGLENILLQNPAVEPPTPSSDEFPASGKIIECCGCPMVFSSEEKFEAHVQQVHEPHRHPLRLHRSGKSCECFRCYKLVRNLKQHHMRGNFCKVCSEYVVDSTHYRMKHQAYYTSEQELKIECCGCSRIFNTEEAFKVHVDRIHKPQRSTNVKPGRKECFRCFKSVLKIKEHHMRELYCKICSKQFPNVKSANLHYRHKHINSGERAQSETKICCGCATQFKTIGDLKLHSNQVHYQHLPPLNPERPFQCEICFDNYPTYEELHKHQTRYQENNKPHKCGQCARSFFFLNALRDHVKTHSN